MAMETKVGVFGLASVAFFWVSGGVYGNEELLLAAPPAYIFLGLLIMPLVYSLPIALVTAELSTLMPVDSGLVMWVREAFGKRVGNHNAYWVWVCWLVDSSVYPVLASAFIIREFGFSASAQPLIASMVRA